MPLWASHVLCYSQLGHNKPGANAPHQGRAAVTAVITGFSIFLFNFTRQCCNESKFYSASYFLLKLSNGGGDFRQYVISLPTAVNKNLKGCLSIFSLKKNPKSS